VISDPQIRASRGFLAWTARDLENRAVVAIATAQNGELAASRAALVAIQATLATKGIAFANDHGVPGVRPHQKKPTPEAIG
jgi:hypothetical protein